MPDTNAKLPPDEPAGVIGMAGRHESVIRGQGSRPYRQDDPVWKKFVAVEFRLWATPAGTATGRAG